MSFRSTDRIITRKENESLCHCDWCDRQISENAFTSGPHWDLWDNTVPSYSDSPPDNFDFCSLGCLSTWAADGKRRATPYRAEERKSQE